VWWVGLLISLIIAFATFGRLPLIFFGAMVTSFAVRQRIGEFRYGFSVISNAMISYWGVMANLVLAIFFGLANYLSPNYFFQKGLLLNVLMAVCSLLPAPQMDGLNMFFGSRTLYYVGVVLTILAAILLLTKTFFGLIVAIVIAVLYGGVAFLIWPMR